MGGVNVEDSYEGDFQSRRALIWTMDFTIRGYLYPNIKGKGFGDGSDNEATKLIRTSIINFHVVPNVAQVSEDPEYIVSESDNAFGTRSYMVNEEDSSKFVAEGSTDRNLRDGIKSRITGTVGNVPMSDEYDITETRDFFAEGIDYDPVTGLDTRAPSLDVQALGNKNL